MKIYVILKNGELYTKINTYYKSEKKANTSLISHLESIVWKEEIYKRFPDKRTKEVAISELLPEFEIKAFE